MSCRRVARRGRRFAPSRDDGEDLHAGLAVDLQPATDRADPFPHADQAKTAPGAGRPGGVQDTRVEADAIVPDAQPRLLRPVFQQNAGFRGLGVLGDIGQGLLGHAQQGGFDIRGQRPRRTALLEGYREVNSERADGESPQRVAKLAALQYRLAQVPYRAPGLGQ